MRGFKIANSPLRQRLLELTAQDEGLARLYRETASHLALGERDRDEVTMKLTRERKRLTDLLKMVAYQAETDLLMLASPHYARADDEGRTLIQSMLMNAGDLEVGKAELRITFAPLISPRRTKVLTELCEQLTATQTAFPGTGLRLAYEVKPHASDGATC